MADPVGDPFQIDKKEQERRVAKNRRAERKPPPPRTGNPYPPPASTTATVPLLPGTGPTTTPPPTTTPAPPAKTPAKPPAKTPAAKAPAKPPAKKTTTAAGPTGPTGATGTSSTQVSNRLQFAQALIQQAGWANNASNQRFLVQWMANEEPAGEGPQNNPFASTLGYPGGPPTGKGKFNPQGVQDYPDLKTGLAMTLQTLGSYTTIMASLKAGTASEDNAAGKFATELHAWSAGPSAPWSEGYKQITGAYQPDAGLGPKSGGTAPVGPAADISSTSGTIPATPPVITPNNVGTGPPIPPGDVVGKAAIKSFIQNNYPTYAWMLDVPQDKVGTGLMDTIESSLKQGLNDSQVQARIGQTQWWLTTTTAQRQYEQMKYTTPQEFKLEQAQAAKVIIGQAANQGVHFPPNSPHLSELVQQYMQFGWGIGPGGAGALRSAIQAVSQDHGVSTSSSAYLNAYLDNPSTAVWTGGAGEKGFEQGLTGQSLTDAAVSHVQTLAGQAGVKLNHDDLIALGSQAAMQGLKDDQISAMINNWSTTGHGQVFNPGYLQLALYQGEQLVPTGNAQNPAGNRSTVMDQAIYQVQQLMASEGVTGLSFGALRNAAQLGLEHGWVTPNVGSVQVQGGSQGDLANYLSKVVKNGQGQQYSSQYIEAQLTTPWVLAPPTQKGASNQYSQTQNQILNNYLPGLKLAGLSKANLTKATDFYLKYLWGQPQGNVDSAMNSYLPTLAAGQPGAGSFAQAYSTALGENNSEAIHFTAKHDSGNLADTAWHAVRNAIAGAGKTGVNDTTLNDLATAYMEHYQGEAGAQDWLNTIGPLVTGKGVQNVNPAYAQQLLANPGELWPTGGYAGTTSASTVLSNILDAAGNSGYTIPTAEVLHLTMLAEEGGWGADATQIKQNVGAYAKGNNLTWTDPKYVIGTQQTPTAYHFPTNWAAYQADQVNPNTPANTAVQTLTMVEQAAGQQGANLSYPQAVEVAKKALKSGITSAQGLDPLIAPYIRLSAGTPAVAAQLPAAGHMGLMPQGGNIATPATPPVNNAPSLFQQLRGLASQYFVNPSDSVLQTWGQNIAAGTQTQQAFQQYLAQQAAQRYPGFEKQLINQNMNMDQATSSLQQLVNQTLELPGDASTLDLASNPQYAKLLDGGFDEGKDGTRVSNGGPMTTSQATQYLQGLPQWQYTNNARTQAANLSDQILQLFGKVS